MIIDVTKIHVLIGSNVRLYLQYMEYPPIRFSFTVNYLIDFYFHLWQCAIVHKKAINLKKNILVKKDTRRNCTEMPCHVLKNIYSHDIDEILDKKIVCGKVRYLVKWKHSNKRNSWEPFEYFQNVKQIDDFENKFSSRSKLTARGEQVFAHTVKHTGN